MITAQFFQRMPQQGFMITPASLAFGLWSLGDCDLGTSYLHGDIFNVIFVQVRAKLFIKAMKNMHTC